MSKTDKTETYCQPLVRELLEDIEIFEGLKYLLPHNQAFGLLMDRRVKRIKETLTDMGVEVCS